MTEEFKVPHNEHMLYFEDIDLVGAAFKPEGNRGHSEEVTFDYNYYVDVSSQKRVEITVEHNEHNGIVVIKAGDDEIKKLRFDRIGDDVLSPTIYTNQ